MGLKVINKQIADLSPLLPFFPSPAMKEVYKHIMVAARCKTIVLLLGEPGTGKTHFGEIIHRLSSRSETGSLIYINCSALQESMLASELFGHNRGAFTGAENNRLGFFRLAHRGTIFFDEIGIMKKPLQEILLSVIKSPVFFPVGSETAVTCDIRFIFATNDNLELLVKKGDFRKDLLDRIDQLRIDIPPLRERMEDLPLLINQFLNEFNIGFITLSDELFEKIKKSFLPGNVRQLRTIIEVAKDYLEEGDTQIMLKHVPKDKLKILEKNILTPVEMDMESRIAKCEREAIEELKEKYNGDMKMVRHKLGISESSLYRKLKDRSGEVIDYQI